ncbi:hypothetical protein ES703_109853 [subsurface metagenome]
MKNEKGFTLIGVVIALAILGVIAAGFLSGLAGASRALFTADERTTANNLAESQMEDAKNQPYIDYSADPHDVYNTISPPTGYSVNLTAVPFDPNTGQDYNQVGGIFEQDDGIQKITVAIEHHGREVMILEDYKVN